MMDIKYLLEKAKQLLEKDKGLVPVLFIETEKAINIVELVGEFNKVNKRKLMNDFGMKFAKDHPNENMISISMVSEANVSKIYDNKDIIEKCEAIVIAKLNVTNNKKEIVTQEFERTDDNIKFKDSPCELDGTVTFLLEEFMKGFYQIRKKNVIKYN